MDGLTHGFVASGFEEIAQAFEANFSERGEVGAAFAAVLDGELVVDLWGGLADSAQGRAWDRDTAVVVFSGTKGMVALCLLMLADRGRLDLDAPVADYWPAFAANGKEEVRVLDVASHQARLPAVHAPISAPDLLDGERMAALLAAQPPDPDPRTRPFIYHAFTYGWLCGELVRRVDGRSIGRFFAEEVAEPLGLEAWIGIDATLESRVACLRYGVGMEEFTRAISRADADPLLAAVYLGGAVFPVSEADLPWNRPEFHQAEIPGAGGIATARALARMYGALACGEPRLLSPELLVRARRRIAGGDPFEEGIEESFGIGFHVQDGATPRVLGPPDDAFGHGGAGGSIHGAWPQQRVGYSYAMNELRDDGFPDARADVLLNALHRAVGR
jgi:CubicO group peptidase (beta-lactamase class C family)